MMGCLWFSIISEEYGKDLKCWVVAAEFCLSLQSVETHWKYSLFTYCDVLRFIRVANEQLSFCLEIDSSAVATSVVNFNYIISQYPVAFGCCLKCFQRRISRSSVSSTATAFCSRVFSCTARTKKSFATESLQWRPSFRQMVVDLTI